MATLDNGSEILNRLIVFIYGWGWGYTLPFPLLIKKKEITRDTKLRWDLNIYGDDADDFLRAFSKEFHVDISKFKVGDYFGNEEYYISRSIKNLFKNNKAEQTSITVGHLERAIITGRLDEVI